MATVDQNHRSGGGHRKRSKKKIQPVTDQELSQNEPVVEQNPQLATDANGPIREEGNEASLSTATQVEIPSGEERPPTSEPQPEMPSWESLFPNEPAAKAPKSMPEAFARFYDAVYKVPKMMNLGNHWPLSREDAVTLAMATADAINSLPKKSSSQVVQLVKALTKALPFLTLPATAWIITAPRIQMTVDLMAARRTGREQETSFGQSYQEDHRSDQATTRGSTAGLPTWEDYLRRNH